VFAAALLAIPLIWRTPARWPALFGAISFGVGWLAMAVSAGAGAALHHVVLLWPMHLLVIAAVLSRVRGGGLITIVLVVLNLLVSVQYYRDIRQNGPGVLWTRAVNPLVATLREHEPEFVFVVDWGILESTHLLSRGELPLLFANEYTGDPLTQERRELLRQVMRKPRTLFLTHVDKWEQKRGANAAVDAFAAQAGYSKHVVATVNDAFGRQIFAILRYH
jgi:hypothetical protein